MTRVSTPGSTDCHPVSIGSGVEVGVCVGPGVAVRIGVGVELGGEVGRMGSDSMSQANVIAMIILTSMPVAQRGNRLCFKVSFG